MHHETPDKSTGQPGKQHSHLALPLSRAGGRCVDGWAWAWACRSRLHCVRSRSTSSRSRLPWAARETRDTLTRALPVNTQRQRPTRPTLAHLHCANPNTRQHQQTQTQAPFLPPRAPVSRAPPSLRVSPVRCCAVSALAVSPAQPITPPPRAPATASLRPVLNQGLLLRRSQPSAQTACPEQVPASRAHYFRPLPRISLLLTPDPTPHRPIRPRLPKDTPDPILRRHGRNPSQARHCR